jgi:hypothetical protein
MDAYMAPDAKGDQQIRSVAPVAMMNYQGRTLAATTAAKAVARQHPFAQSVKKAQRMMPPIIA